MNKNNQQKQKQGPPNKRTYVDSTTGKKVNDYIPKFISSTPWYYNNDALQVDANSRKRKTDDENYKEIKDKSNDRLKHQRLNPESNEIIKNNEPRRGLGIVDEFKVVDDTVDNDNINTNNNVTVNDDAKNSKLRKKIRDWKKKGRCENCGGKHLKIDCLEKPHNISYIYRTESNNNSKSQTNHILVKADTDDWDVKRDRWRGIDMDDEYDGIVDNLKKKEEKLLNEYKGSNKDANDANDTNDTKNENKSLLIEAITSNTSFAIDPNDKSITTRSLGEKPRYLETIKTGEELRYNPKSRVYKDLNEGYLNERGQFIPYLTGEAAEFEKLKKFNRTIQTKQKQKWENDKEGKESVADKSYATEISPTSAMLKLKEKEEKDALIREAKRKELLEKYGAL
ncbi:mRNA splicing protein [Pichia kluyveri]|uniref:Pre-mRNA-splicing factor SLU7 n=1 Tax=Pichia kluyveri TaxID=36015 RepID=A0AAV5R1A9_PICKL|nr:mRNA splicing protein [Pichia kluyveri]